MKKQTIGFLGAGNMGQSLINGLLSQNYSADQLFVCDHHQDNLQGLSAKYPNIHTTQNIDTLIENSTMVVLAIKPQDLCKTLKDVQNILEHKKPLLISIAAGITTDKIKDCVGSSSLEVIRAMPNTPALLQAGITGLYADITVSPEHKQIAEDLFQAVGETVWVETEDLMDVVTALSGSGPAYFFYMLEALVDEASRLGLPLKTAQTLSYHTLLGAAKMAIHSSDLKQLRQNVTSKGGTTQAGIEALENADLKTIMANALRAATQRSKTLRENA